MPSIPYLGLYRIFVGAWSGQSPGQQPATSRQQDQITGKWAVLSHKVPFGALMFQLLYFLENKWTLMGEVVFHLFVYLYFKSG